MTPNPTMIHLRRELYLLRKLRLDMPGCDFTPEQIRDGIRQAIIDRNLASVITGRGADNEPSTFKAAFELLYQQPLVAKAVA